MLPNLMIHNNFWLVLSVISFIGGRLYLFGKLLGWGDLIDKFYTKL